MAKELPRVDLTPEIRRLQIQTRENFTVSGRIRQASRRGDNQTERFPFDRSARLRRSPPLSVVPWGRLLSGAEFDSPILSSRVLDQDLETDSGSGSEPGSEGTVFLAPGSSSEDRHALGGTRAATQGRRESLEPLESVPDEPEGTEPVDAVSNGQGLPNEGNP